MTSSSNTTVSSSTSSSSTKLSPSLSQYNFDPLAVHPFTNYVSSNPSNGPTVDYTYRQPLGDYPMPHAPIPKLPKPYAYTPPHHTGIFVPFRKETSSPDLSAILKPKSGLSNTPSTTSKTRPTWTQHPSYSLPVDWTSKFRHINRDSGNEGGGPGPQFEIVQVQVLYHYMPHYLHSSSTISYLLPVCTSILLQLYPMSQKKRIKKNQLLKNLSFAHSDISPWPYSGLSLSLELEDQNTSREDRHFMVTWHFHR